LRGCAISTGERNGLVPVKVDTWENFVFVNLDGRAGEFAGVFLAAIPEIVAPLQTDEEIEIF